LDLIALFYPSRERLVERFFEKVNRLGPIPAYRPDLGPCWSWTASTDSKGYGQIWIGSKRHKTHRLVRAHRVSYVLLVGPIPNKTADGKRITVDHLCRNHACVNPRHLEVVTHRENVLRGISGAAVNARKTHCPKGHEYDVVNTYVSPRGGRLCRACHRDYEQRRRDLRKLAA
jgi:hypothetical protein